MKLPIVQRVKTVTLLYEILRFSPEPDKCNTHRHKLFPKDTFLSSFLMKTLPVKYGEEKSYNGSTFLRHAQIVLLHSHVGTPEQVPKLWC